AFESGESSVKIAYSGPCTVEPALAGGAVPCAATGHGAIALASTAAPPVRSRRRLVADGVVCVMISEPPDGWMSVWRRSRCIGVSMLVLGVSLAHAQVAGRHCQSIRGV